MTQNQRQVKEITATAIYKVSEQDCWMVPSDSGKGMYKVCFDEDAANWTCTCKHGEVQAQRGQAAHCKHVAAVQVSIKANMKPITHEYDVVVEASKVASQAQADAIIGDAYERRAKDIERSQYNNVALALGWE